MHTGDLAVIDADGFCKIVGRIYDHPRRWEDIYPREIEGFLYRHPRFSMSPWSVFRVQHMARKYALSCGCGGESAEPDEILAFFKGEIAHYKIPRHVCFVGAFPMTVPGKIQKYILREQIQRAFEDPREVGV